MARVLLTDVAICMILIRFLLSVVIPYVIISHCDFLLCKRNCIPLCLTGKFRKGAVKFNCCKLQNGSLLQKGLKTTGSGYTFWM